MSVHRLSVLRRLVTNLLLVLAAVVPGSEAPALAQSPANGCGALPDHGKWRAALQDIIKLGKSKTTGMGNQRWAAVVDRNGIVCSVVFSGQSATEQWPGSRVIAAEKASTANALSKPDFALSTGNLFFAAQPGQSLYGLTSAVPPNPEAAYGGDPVHFGQVNDPMVGKPIGGIIVFAGGLALYDAHGKIVGGLGVSGDTSCADHVVAWKLRHALNFDGVPAGVAPNSTDNLIFDLQNGSSVSGFGHPQCKGGTPSEQVIAKLPESDPVGQKR
jgi:uncharacterized protein GlcG (DUF336 family)